MNNMIDGADIGDMIIGDTVTHIDLPYKCKHCKRKVSLENRFRWQHDCRPKHKR